MSDVLIRVDGRAGRITLNRPKALNAVTWGMVRDIHAALKAWANSDEISLVIMDGEGDRAFGAGGDIVELYRRGCEGDHGYGRQFWAEEYRLNLAIAEYPKPIVSLMHGFTMGGGVGLSCHASHRIVDESVQIAMPECGIGLIPDVGGTWLLAQAPQHLGVFLGLTGYRMGPEDALFANFADHFVPREAWPTLIDALCRDGDIALIEAFSSRAPAGQLAQWPELNDWFSGATIQDILDALDRAESEEATRWAKTLRRSSPLSLACSLTAIRRASSLSLKEALAQEFRFVWRAMEFGDILEGIRAQVIDKDRSPVWRHESVSALNDEDVAAMFAPLGSFEWTSEEGIS